MGDYPRAYVVLTVLVKGLEINFCMKFCDGTFKAVKNYFVFIGFGQ